MNTETEPTVYFVWPDGTYTESDEYINNMWDYQHLSDDYHVEHVTRWNNDGTPIFPSQNP